MFSSETFVTVLGLYPSAPVLQLRLSILTRDAPYISINISIGLTNTIGPIFMSNIDFPLVAVCVLFLEGRCLVVWDLFDHESDNDAAQSGINFFLLYRKRHKCFYVYI